MLYLLAVIPGIILFIAVWKADTVEKEPPKLLALLFLCGALSLISAILLKLLGNGFMGLTGLDKRYYPSLFIDSFIFTALAVEAGKLIL